MCNKRIIAAINTQQLTARSPAQQSPPRVTTKSDLPQDLARMRSSLLSVVVLLLCGTATTVTAQRPPPATRRNCPRPPQPQYTASCTNLAPGATCSVSVCGRVRIVRIVKSRRNAVCARTRRIDVRTLRSHMLTVTRLISRAHRQCFNTYTRICSATRCAGTALPRGRPARPRPRAAAPAPVHGPTSPFAKVCIRTICAHGSCCAHACVLCACAPAGGRPRA